MYLTRMQAIVLMCAAIFGSVVIGVLVMWVSEWNYWQNVTAGELWATLGVVFILWMLIFAPGKLDELKQEEQRKKEEALKFQRIADNCAENNKQAEMGKVK